MTAAVLVFAGLGASLAGLLALVLRPGPGLLPAIGRLDAGRAQVAAAGTSTSASWADRQVLLGRRTREVLTAGPRPRRVLAGLGERRAADLAITEGSEELLLGRQVLTGLVGVLTLPAVALAIAPVGLHLPVPVLVIGPAALAVPLAWLPHLQLRRDAAARRREFRHALGSYLDLVAMSLAAGRGAAQALAETAALSGNWVFRAIGDTLTTARLSGTNHWRGLGELGERLAVGELRDLAASLALVGDHGARIRETLTARAATLRRRAVSDAEGEAAAADQGMRIAQVLLALGFLVLIAYPAVAAVLAM